MTTSSIIWGAIIIVALILFFWFINRRLMISKHSGEKEALLFWIETRIRNDVTTFLKSNYKYPRLQGGVPVVSFEKTVDNVFSLYAKIYQDHWDIYEQNFKITDTSEIKSRVFQSLEFYGVSNRLFEIILSWVKDGKSIGDFLYLFKELDRMSSLIYVLSNIESWDEIKMVREKVLREFVHLH